MRAYLVVVAVLGLGSGAASAQPPRTGIPHNSQSLITPVLPDLVAFEEVVPATIVEQWTTTHPCTTHSHTRTAYIRIKGRFGVPTPAPTAILYRDNQPIETWTLTVPSGTQQITLGYFTWTSDHPCPSGGNSISSVPPVVNNYRLVVDPSGQLTELSEANNSVAFYIGPTVPFIRAP